MKQSFNFEPTDTILQIKQALQEKEGIDVAMIRLIYGGKSLADESTIASSNMKAGDTIHMLLQLKGGFWEFILQIDLIIALTDAQRNIPSWRRY